MSKAWGLSQWFLEVHQPTANNVTPSLVAVLSYSDASVAMAPTLLPARASAARCRGCGAALR
eukprot:447170-Pleurochrysis_carterae.AAC.1